MNCFRRRTANRRRWLRYRPRCRAARECRKQKRNPIQRELIYLAEHFIFISVPLSTPPSLAPRCSFSPKVSVSIFNLQTRELVQGGINHSELFLLTMTIIIMTAIKNSLIYFLVCSGDGGEFPVSIFKGPPQQTANWGRRRGGRAANEIVWKLHSTAITVFADCCAEIVTCKGGKLRVSA